MSASHCIPVPERDAVMDAFRKVAQGPRHDDATIEAADHILDMGPGPGIEGEQAYLAQVKEAQG